jgi:hypothetical protein
MVRGDGGPMDWGRESEYGRENRPWPRGSIISHRPTVSGSHRKGRAEDSSRHIVSSSKLPALFRAQGSIGLVWLAVNRVRVVGEACGAPGPVGTGASRLSVAASLLAPSPSRKPGFLHFSVSTHEKATAPSAFDGCTPPQAYPPAAVLKWHLICKNPLGR